jgi:hypothetical protein
MPHRCLNFTIQMKPAVPGDEMLIAGPGPFQARGNRAAAPPIATATANRRRRMHALRVNAKNRQSC